MKLFIEVFSDDKNFGIIEYEAGKRSKIRDVEKFITKDIAGDEFRRIVLVEDFMRAVFSNPITVPLKICEGANLLASIEEHRRIRLNFLFERSPLVFRIGFDGSGEKADIEEIKNRMYSSGHYVGMYPTPDIPFDDLNEFVNKRKRLPVDASSIPDSVEITARKGRKKVDLKLEKETPFLDVAVKIFEELGVDPEVPFSVRKGGKDDCLLVMEYPPHSINDGFSRVSLGEMVAAFKGEMIVDYDDGEIIISAPLPV